MQNISEISLTNTQQLKLSAEQAHLAQKLVINQSYPIKNAQSDGQVLKAEIQINGAWQQVSLPLSTEQKQNKFLVQSGTLTFNSQQLITLKEHLSVAIKLQPNELLSLLKLFTPASNTQLGSNSVLLPVTVNPSLNKLFFPTLKAALPTNSSIAGLLAKTDNLVATMNFKNGQVMANISAPPHSRIIHSQAFSAEKLLGLLSKGLSEGEIRIPTAQNLELKVANKHISLPITRASKIEPEWHAINHLSKNKNELHLSVEKAPISLQISLCTKANANSMDNAIQNSQLFNEQQNNPKQSAVLTTPNQPSSSGTATLTTLWHKISRAVQPAAPSGPTAQPAQQLKLETTFIQQNLSANTSTAGSDLSQKMEGKTLFQATDNQVQKTQTLTSDKANNGNLPLKIDTQASNRIFNTGTSQKTSHTNSLSLTDKPHDKLDLNQLGKVINRLSEQGIPEAKELNKLIHRAFSQLISAETLSPNKVQTEVTQIIQPTKLPTAIAPSAFANAINLLSVELLTLDLAQHHNQQLTINNKLEGILQLFFPKNKFDLNSLLSQHSANPVLQDIGQIQSALQSNQLQNTTQPDLPSIFQFLLPMKLAAEAQQTEVKIGHYEKKNKVDGASKKIWFVRLNFDLGELGKLQTHAQIMGKSVSFDLVASSEQLTTKTEPHIHSLKQRLNEHGLHIEQITLKHAKESSSSFFDQHSIINIKV